MVEFTDTVQCPLCGSIYSNGKGHACSKLNDTRWYSNDKGTWEVEPVMGIGETLRCILAELRQIRALMEGDNDDCVS